VGSAKVTIGAFSQPLAYASGWLRATTLMGPWGGVVISWQCSRFNELSIHELYAILKARQVVFIVEQNCPFLDADGVDQLCWHLIAWRDDVPERKPLAYARIVPPGIKYEEASIGRVITTPEGRGQGYGKELMRRAVKKVEELYAGQSIRIGAQQYLEKFYACFGFTTVSKPYIEDGIPHVEMVRRGI
jgi:ElaA protein